MTWTSFPEDLPVIEYPEGSSGPAAVLGLPDAGDLSSATLLLEIAREIPGGELIATMSGSGSLAGGTDTVTITWSSADLGALTVGKYGMTISATVSGKVMKWRGALFIENAS